MPLARPGGGRAGDEGGELHLPGDEALDLADGLGREPAPVQGQGAGPGGIGVEGVGEGAPGEVADAPRGGARLDEGEELLVEAAVDGRDEVRAQPVDEEGAQHAGRPVARPGGPGEGIEGLPVGPQDLGDDQLLRSELGADALETAQLVGRERRHVDALGQARGHGRRRREHLEVDEVGLRREAEELGAALGKIDGSRCAALTGAGLRCTPLGV